MNIRIRLFAFLFLVTVVPFSLGVSILVRLTSQAFVDATIRQLESVAMLQEGRVVSAMEQLFDVFELVSYRTRSGMVIADALRAGGEGSAREITTILQDVKFSHQGLKMLSVINTDGLLVASTNPAVVGTSVKKSAWFERGIQTYTLAELIKDEDNVLSIRIVGPIVSEGKTVGMLEVIANADPMVAITEDYTGLGETGETVLMTKNLAGDALFITPLRFDPGAALRRAIAKEQTHAVATHAVSGDEEILDDIDHVNYRGKPVIAVTRYLEFVGWGMSVQIDRDEVFKPIRDLQNRIWMVVVVFYVLALSACLAAPLVSSFAPEDCKIEPS